MSDNLPLVTVYIPTYNRVELLQRAVKSVQEQTYKNLEIIIVDDCSTDGTHAYLEQLVKEDKRVRYFLKETNSGACVSRNIAIEHAQGEFITGLDDDDYFAKTRLEVFINSWRDNDNALFSNILYKRQGGSFKSNNCFAMKKLITPEDLLKANHIGNQIFTKTETLKKTGGFDPKMQVWQDLELWYRLTKIGMARRIQKDLYVMDVSHPHERISHKKGKKVQNSYEYFIKKHSLDSSESINLSTHMTNYEDIKLSLNVYLKKFLNFTSLGTLKLLILKFLKN